MKGRRLFLVRDKVSPRSVTEGTETAASSQDAEKEGETLILSPAVVSEDEDDAGLLLPSNFSLDSPRQSTSASQDTELLDIFSLEGASTPQKPAASQDAGCPDNFSLEGGSPQQTTAASQDAESPNHFSLERKSPQQMTAASSRFQDELSSNVSNEISPDRHAEDAGPRPDPLSYEALRTELSSTKELLASVMSQQHDYELLISKLAIMQNQRLTEVKAAHEQERKLLVNLATDVEKSCGARLSDMKRDYEEARLALVADAEELRVKLARTENAFDLYVVNLKSEHAHHLSELREALSEQEKEILQLREAQASFVRKLEAAQKEQQEHAQSENADQKWTKDEEKSNGPDSVGRMHNKTTGDYQDEFEGVQEKEIVELKQAQSFFETKPETPAQLEQQLSGSVSQKLKEDKRKYHDRLGKFVAKLKAASPLLQAQSSSGREVPNIGGEQNRDEEGDSNPPVTLRRETQASVVAKLEAAEKEEQLHAQSTEGKEDKFSAKLRSSSLLQGKPSMAAGMAGEPSDSADENSTERESYVPIAPLREREIHAKYGSFISELHMVHREECMALEEKLLEQTTQLKQLEIAKNAMAQKSTDDLQMCVDDYDQMIAEANAANKQALRELNKQLTIKVKQVEELMEENADQKLVIDATKRDLKDAVMKCEDNARFHKSEAAALSNVISKLHAEHTEEAESLKRELAHKDEKVENLEKENAYLASSLKSMTKTLEAIAGPMPESHVDMST